MIDDTQKTLVVKGSLTVTEVPRWCREWSRKLHTVEKVDLSQIERADSSALAWLLELKSNAGHSSISFVQPPAALLTLARLSGVADLLGWDGN